ncbi:MAG: diphosphomevalonate decarboxylase [Flavobacteriaceae bacterium CG_4_8_14_3_um_filter_34_10]|nr:diphosphomevalonate decarboxylase [Flavobacteriia bacterium]OIP50907.1 MAG: diphosphomevalonate decarboxylase [Flavobacteriaceae bacterium CG2_30_34_30]PIQ17439.1 MAG: diphosphomevalonate decarboxylase [Flavobacteriaceae bacterium CG18_big_fil_WC_8_21_14_2_50_34_36]PIV48681.1 MAG: diphosphomevalonate decarboxylase [Flavobacteriaceae bacterium CG02_land_8_20_14_3_00_34_13]PIX09072.1 MAG: diphosphomevalonate decarboxylase [Flavobacteriaceae bacterium CG_4_8_14_3_um_filter_34_10]PIZ07108.1 MAG
MTEQNFLSKPYSYTLEKGQVSWQSPSNIALVKYWGKHGEQLPKNTSISFTLSNCHTQTTLFYEPKTKAGFDFEIYLDGKLEEGFEPKILKFFQRIENYLLFLKEYSFKIETFNSFPHSSGIASSASGMSALALCLMEMERKFNPEISKEYFHQKASFLARLGSGSACRSIEGPLVVWGEHSKVIGSTNLFGITYPLEIHKNFKKYQDTILLVDQGEKQVSSTVGHDLMHNHPFAEERFAQANTNLEKLIPILKSGNLDGFIEIVESEALSLHAMMMTSMPYFILMKPNTLEIINRIWEYRKKTGSKVCFTLDAGANVHVLYPELEKKQVYDFIKKELVAYCQNSKYICDLVGKGAKKVYI